MCTLTSKYNVAGPRYTSYPTVPYWDNDRFSLQDWKTSLVRSFSESNATEGISLYIHLPFCESMCTFCGCNKRITKNHDVELPYMKSVLKEFILYNDLFNEKPIIKQVHLGGGTPTFFSPEHLDTLLNGIFTIGEKAENCELSFEGHPNNTTKRHLVTLANKGFTRVCYGVQDYNDKVQKAINRVQPYENVLIATTMARGAGYTSVGHDIIYGLPFQTQDDVINTINKTITLRPDRIAFYSYANVPWIKGNGQRGFADTDLPTASQKSMQYKLGKERLIQAGYIEIGMDHYTLPSDSLYKAQKNGTIHRNFMGFNDNKTQVTIGLGVSSISDSWYSFAQNVKNVEDYQKLVEDGIIPVTKGHILNNEDLIIRQHILNLMCQFKTSWEDKRLYCEELPDILIKLLELEKDDLVKVYCNSLVVTKKGRAYIRNICLPFDKHLNLKKPKTQLFSMTV